MDIKDFYSDYSRGMPETKQMPLGNEKRVMDILPYFKSPALDVGCAKGYDVIYFANHGFKVSGCDLSPESIAVAKKNYPANEFFVHDFTKERLEKKFKTIYSFDVIEHLFDYDAFLKNLHHSLEDDGYLILSTPNILGLQNRINFILGQARYFEQYAHIRFFNPSTMQTILERNGFKVERIFGYSSLPLPASLSGSLTVIARKKINHRQGFDGCTKN